ncbi:hypothetical protein GALMADRAFT_55704 [Galerina marginata CBS 339.88]|uniref:XRRM domain-containing protein n=1 Tax=Galerina marginata (strain CBS 339.88) TaxID=685588 RepID=A0A067TPB1_GALM3|nr:hypothetical protein GALMADRAFT_55704 [Galerina marginata CBS 339.88]
MSTIPFVPRSVKRRKIDALPAQDLVSTSVASKPTPTGAPIASGDLLPRRIVNEKTKGKEKELTTREADIQDDESPRDSSNATVKPVKGPALEDLSLLVWLALSDYALWSDIDLRRKIDWSSDLHNTREEGNENASKSDRNERGYIPLAYLFKHSFVFLSASTSPLLFNQPETLYVKAIRTHADHLVDVRLIVSDDVPFGRATGHWAKHPPPSTGYEVRRTEAGDLVEKYGKADWDKLTVYVENIPTQFRNLPGATSFVLSLLPSSEQSVTRVQNVSFPLHHNDKPGSIPVCKGFALVVLSSAEDVRFLLDEWPWDGRKTEAKSKPDEGLQAPHSHLVFIREAQKFGLRCLSKTRWEELKAEYLLHRQQLVEELSMENDTQAMISKSSTNEKSSRPELGPVLEHLQAESTALPTGSDDIGPTKPLPIHVGSLYPSGCLVFVRNVHSETNKTTLRALFSQAWKTAVDPTGTISAERLDYVDYMKGLDTCHVRFSSQPHATHFIDHFVAHPTTQASGLDGVGTQLSTSEVKHTKGETISPELVLGKREEVYWEKVPQKVRKQAVEKALKTMHEGAEKESGGMGNEAVSKRRKRGGGWQIFCSSVSSVLTLIIPHKIGQLS